MARTNISYLSWLGGLVKVPNPSYSKLLELAWNTPYRYTVPNDDNRALDGLSLRERFEVETSNEPPNPSECRMLEFLIGLAVRMEELSYDYQHDGRTADFFWQILRNLYLDVYDNHYIDRYGTSGIEQIFQNINERNYEFNGEGGPFPLEFPDKDQRNVEVWYQMQAYLQENL